LGALILSCAAAAKVRLGKSSGDEEVVWRKLPVNIWLRSLSQQTINQNFGKTMDILSVFKVCLKSSTWKNQIQIIFKKSALLRN